MKIRTAVFLGLLSWSSIASAQIGGPSAQGTYRFVLEDGTTKYLDFSASTDSRGVTSGLMRFVDPTPIFDVFDPDDPRGGEEPRELSITATFTDLTVARNRAVMNGTVRESSHSSYVGKWIQLVVEDNGNNTRVPDQLTWSFCRPRSGTWIPVDAEVPGDRGAYFTWWATDAERRDDVGIPSASRLPVEEQACPALPLDGIPFADVLEAAGDIVVTP